jgi:hypothetical protein
MRDNVAIDDMWGSNSLQITTKLTDRSRQVAALESKLDCAQTVSQRESKYESERKVSYGRLSCAYSPELLRSQRSCATSYRDYHTSVV